MFEALKRIFQQNKPSSPTQKQSDGRDSACDDHSSSAPDKPDSEGKVSSEERLVLLVEASLEHLQAHGLGEEGKDGYYVVFDVPETNHEGVLKLAKERWSGQEHWQFSVGVHEAGRSRLHSYLLCGGYGQEGKDKIAAYLTRPELKMELVASVKKLSHSVWLDD